MMKIFRIGKEQGAVLAIGLIILFVLTLIGVTSLQNNALEESITGNLKDMNIAFQTADTALRQGEAFVETLTNTSAFGSGGGLYLQSSAPDPFDNGTWSGSASTQVTISMPGVVLPRYYIVFIGSISGSNNTQIFNYGQNPQPGGVSVFLVVAKGTGGTGLSNVILESFYGKQM
jgi:type IV pilus assembly protein PilX